MPTPEQRMKEQSGADAQAVKELGAAKLEKELMKLAHLSPIEYDKTRKNKAKELGLSVSVLDIEVKQRRLQEDTRQGQALQLESPEPWDEPVDGAPLVSALVGTLQKYIVADTDVLAVVAFWALHAHSYQSAVHTPRLNITAPEKGCGKTLVLDLLEHLTPKAMRTENLSSAVMFRLVDSQQPTLLIDEYDTFLRDSEDMRGALNAGWQRGGKHLRCEGDKYEVRAFRTFAPVALAGIKGLPSTLHDRSILIRMTRDTKVEVSGIQHFDSRHTQDLKVLNRQAARWATDNIQALTHADPGMPDGFFNRVADRWRHLFAIADIIGGDWPAKLRGIAAVMESGDSQDSIGVMLLQDIQTILNDRDRITSESLTEELLKLENSPWPEYGRQQKPITKNKVARLLGSFGIKPKQLWICGTNHRGYELAQFRDAFDRYLRPVLPTQSARTLERSQGAGSSTLAVEITASRDEEVF